MIPSTAQQTRIRRWDKLTLLLRKAGAPLDNHVCESALKKAILPRRNSLFYRTQNGFLPRHYRQTLAELGSAT
jgi:hypothetical protein